MKNQCTTPETIPALSTYLTTDVVLDDPSTTPESCKTDLKDADKKQCQNFTEWTQYTASIDGAVGLAAQIVHKTVKDEKISNIIVLSLKTVYDSICGVNKQFLVAIVDINAGTPYHPIPQPDPIPPFPMPTGKDDVAQAVEEAWTTLKPWLEKLIGKMAPKSPWIKVLEGIIESSDLMIADLKELFEQV